MLDCEELLKRYEKARTFDPEELNCISALFYLLGKDDFERPHRTEDFGNLGLIALPNSKRADVLRVIYPTEHFAIMHPKREGYIIHRNGKGAQIIIQPWSNIEMQLRMSLPDFNLSVHLEYYCK